MKLIINGDDLGISKGVNYAMMDCYNLGIMRSCSMMVNMPDALHAVKLMRQNKGLSVGIHLNLTVGKPLLNTHKTLVKEDGHFNKKMLKESDHVDINEIEAELTAQILKYIDLVGKKPDHINSHHGIELIKGAEKIVCQLSKEYDLPVRRFFTVKKHNHNDIDYILPKMKSNHSFNQLTTTESLINLYTKEEINSNDFFEFALHPGYVDYTIEQISSLTIGRVHDANVFMDEKCINWVKENNIELITYKDIPKKNIFS